MPETKPRYTVELTTEGWQIKDNVKDTICAGAYGSERHAVEGARDANAAAAEREADIDSVEGEGRR